MQVKNKLLDIPADEIQFIPLKELKILAADLSEAEADIITLRKKWNILKSLGFKVTTFVAKIAKAAKRSENMVYRVYFDENKHRNREIQNAMYDLFCEKVGIKEASKV